MYMFDQRITIEDRPILDPYLTSFEYKASGMTFTSLYMWRNINHFSWQIIGDYLCIAGTSHLELGNLEVFMFPPLTKTGSYDAAGLRESIFGAKKVFEENGHKFLLRLMPFHMLDILKTSLPGELLYTDDRPNYDYVYLTKDLAELPGRAFHSKKNHLNYFHNNFKYEYGHLTPAMAEEGIEFIREFNKRKDLPEYERELLEMEETAIKDVFMNLDRINYLTGAIRIDGKLEAFCIGGALGKRAVTVHVEKANVLFRGSYQAINNEFAKEMPPHIKYINREEDMGIPGLRKAKFSYRPVKLVESYIACFPGER